MNTHPTDYIPALYLTMYCYEPDVAYAPPETPKVTSEIAANAIYGITSSNCKATAHGEKALYHT